MRENQLISRRKMSLHVECNRHGGDFLLQAKNNRGELVPVWHFNRTQLKALQKKEVFYCPDCQEEVKLKVGEKNTPHFSHKIECSCVRHGESVYHDTGKRDLYNWLQNQGFKVQLETYLPRIQQRPDLLLQLKNKQIAIEYQCANLPREEMIKRTRGYHKENIIPVWILGAAKLQRTKPHAAKLSVKDQVFLSQFSSDFPLSVFYYCSNTKKFILYQDIIFFSKTKTFGCMKVVPIEKLQWRELFYPRYRNPKLLKAYWKKEKEKWRHRPVAPYQKQETLWRQWLYGNKFNVQSLPSYVYIPTQLQYRMQTPPWVWQSRLYIDLLLNYKTFTYENASQLVAKHYCPRENFPLIKEYKDPIMEYLYLLQRIGILRKINNTYVSSLPTV